MTPRTAEVCDHLTSCAPAHRRFIVVPRPAPAIGDPADPICPELPNAPQRARRPRRRWTTGRCDRRAKGSSRPRPAPGLGGVKGATDQVGAAASAHLGAGDRSGSEPTLDERKKVRDPFSPGWWRLEPHNPGWARDELCREHRSGEINEQLGAVSVRGHDLDGFDAVERQGRAKRWHRRGEMQPVMGTAAARLPRQNGHGGWVGHGSSRSGEHDCRPGRAGRLLVCSSPLRLWEDVSPGHVLLRPGEGSRHRSVGRRSFRPYHSRLPASVTQRGTVLGAAMSYDR